MRIQEKMETLRRVGINLLDFEIELIGCLYQIGEGFSSWATATEIWQQLTSRSAKPKQISKAWVYRGLSELVERGFIQVDRINRPIKFMMTSDTLVQGIERKKSEKKEELLEMRRVLSKRVDSFARIDAKELATDLMNYLKGEGMAAKSGVIEGIDNVRAVIDQEIVGRAQAGDKIWIINPISILQFAQMNSPTYRKIFEATDRDVNIRGLLILTGEEETTNLPRIDVHMTNTMKLFLESMQQMSIEIRVLPSQVRTYRMLGLNKERIMLYLSDVAQADIAALIRYEDNPSFVEDAASSFERLWEQGQNFLARMTELVSES